MSTSVEGGGHKECHDLLGQPHPDDSSAHRQHVGVVVSPSHTSGVEVVAQRRAHAAYLVGSKLFTLTAAAEDDAHIGIAVANESAHTRTDRGVIHALGGIGAAIHDLVTLGGQQGNEVGLELEACVIGADGDA